MVVTSLQLESISMELDADTALEYTVEPGDGVDWAEGLLLAESRLDSAHTVIRALDPLA